MHRRARLIPIACAALALAMLACTSAPRTFQLEDLDDLVLQRDEAPKGASVDATSSGSQTLAELAEDDAVKEAGLRDAGFVRGHFQLFITDNVVGRDSKGVLANSFALLFLTADGASRGLTVFEDAIRRDGQDLRELGLDLGEEGFALVGTLQRGLPPGYAFLWRRSNVILGLIAAGNIAGISENAARELAAIMDGHATA